MASLKLMLQDSTQLVLLTKHAIYRMTLSHFFRIFTNNDDCLDNVYEKSIKIRRPAVRSSFYNSTNRNGDGHDASKQTRDVAITASDHIFTLIGQPMSNQTFYAFGNNVHLWIICRYTSSQPKSLHNRHAYSHLKN